MATYDLTIGTISKLKTGDIINCPFSGSMKSLELPKGIYKLECWGSQGGSYNTYYGGNGGYSTGVLTLDTDTTVYLYTGGQPATVSTSRVVVPGGFNGGGNGYNRYYSSTYTYGQGGGGASDIRLGQDSLYARLIVAGGGGGSASVDAANTKYGGGVSGGSPQSGYGATQTSPGTNGSFGNGASVTTSGSNYKYSSGGGGGGWYGGGANSEYSDSSSGYRNYNGGGSGCVYTSSTASNYPSGRLLNSAYYLTDASTISGNSTFISPDGTSETGHSGNGYIRITVLNIDTIAFRIKKNTKFIKSNTAFIKQNSGTWEKAVEAYIKVPVHPTKLLLHGEELLDNSNYSIPITNSGVIISEEQSKFGSKSMYFNGQAYLKLDELIPVNGDFTVDWWEYCTGNSATRFAQSINGGCGGICAGGSTNINSLYISSTGSSWNIASGTVMFSTTLNSWVHWALIRNESTWTTYRNGAQFAQITGNETVFTNKNGLVIGSFLYDSNHYFVGYIDEFRISSIARWTEDFAPPTAPYNILEDTPYAVWKKAIEL